MTNDLTEGGGRDGLPAETPPPAASPRGGEGAGLPPPARSDGELSEFMSRLVSLARTLPELSLENQVREIREDIGRLAAAAHDAALPAAVERVWGRLNDLGEESRSRHHETLEVIGRVADLAAQIKEAVDGLRLIAEGVPPGTPALEGEPGGAHEARPARAGRPSQRGGAPASQVAAHREETVPVSKLFIDQLRDLRRELTARDKRLRSLVGTVCSCLRTLDESLSNEGPHQEVLGRLRRHFVKEFENEDVVAFEPEAGDGFEVKAHENALDKRAVTGRVLRTLLPGYRWEDMNGSEVISEVMVRARVEVEADA